MERKAIGQHPWRTMMMTVEMMASGVEDKDKYSHKARHSDTFRVMCLIHITDDTPLPAEVWSMQIPICTSYLQKSTLIKDEIFLKMYSVK